MEFWIIITLIAAFFQNLRSAAQKRLSGDLGVSASAYTRFLFALPFALLYLVGLFHITATQIPEPNALFLVYAISGGAAQILATSLLIMSFKDNQFAQGTAYSKTEVVQIAVIGFILLGESVSPIFGVGVFVSLVGVLGLIGYKNIFGTTSGKGFSGRVALPGIGAGAGFALSVVCYRGASLALDEALDPVHRAAFTLACVLAFQTVAMGSYLLIRLGAKLKAVFRQWKTGTLVGLAGMLASAAWFTALSMQSAAYVRALGQVELIFAMLTSTLIFKERLSRNDFLSILLLSMGIMIVVLS